MTVAVPPRRWGLWLAFAAVAALLVLLAVGISLGGYLTIRRITV